MSAKLNNQQKDSLVSFFLLTFLITWGLGALAIFLPAQFQAIFGELTDTSPIYFFAIAAPTLSATILTFVRDGWKGLGSLYGRLVRWRFGLKWYALVLIGIPAVGWIAARITGASPLKQTNTTAEFLTLLFYLLVTGPLCEELGWRGYALPRLLQRFSPFTASLILGVIWGVWHLPSFFVGGMVQSGMSLILFILYTPFLSILMTWVFKHTGGSVLIAVLIHYMANICTTIIGVTLPTLGAMWLTISILLLTLDKQFGWFHSSNFDRRVLSIGAAPTLVSRESREKKRITNDGT
jgi:membrane protease YdiL (CAAX protease family)